MVMFFKIINDYDEYNRMNIHFLVAIFNNIIKEREFEESNYV